MRAAMIVQRGLRTPTGPFFARFFIGIILGLVAEFAFMVPSTRMVLSSSAASWKRQNHPCRRHHKCKLGDQTKDDADKEPREERSCGRSQASLYNHRRPHQAMNNQFPMAAWRAGTDRIEAAKTVDMPLRLDNANALPT